ncbi:hypothetical protein CLOM_g7411 [Closterium sp. NIES-68]|nr:hypothetical protein CLOM_g7411 [Closterium sp. NIES-68]
MPLLPQDRPHEEEVQQGDERAPSLPPRATSARGNRPDLPQRHESIQVPAAEEEGRGRRRTQPPIGFKCVKGPAEESVGEEERRVFTPCLYS